MKRVKSHLAPEQAEEFEKSMASYAKKIIANFKDYEFYTGRSMNTTGMIALLNVRNNSTTHYFTFWKYGLNIKE